MTGRLWPAIVAAVVVAGCDNGSTSSNTTLTPTIVTPPSITETFNGAVAVGGASTVNFTVTQAGPLALTLTAAGPPPTITMGFGVGQPLTATSSTCQLFSGGSIVTAAGSAAQLASSAAFPPGLYCFVVVDVGNQTAGVTYTVTVTHT